MGWFEELAKSAGYTSLGALARKAVTSKHWPAGESTNARSVENMLRLLDQSDRKGQVWLEKRPAVRVCFAEILGVSPESLEPGFHEPGGPVDPVVELTELREARPLNLRREGLFPGIPARVLDPSGWGRSWWVASSGAGKSLVGQWLQARGLAAFLRGHRLADVLPGLPAEGAVFIELSRVDAQDVALLEERFALRAVCVAAPVPPPRSRPLGPAGAEDEVNAAHEDLDGGDGDVENDEGAARPELEAGWRLIRTPAVREWIDSLVRWVADRMSDGGGFDVNAAYAVADLDRGGESLVTPGDWLGLFGVLEKLGSERFWADGSAGRWVGAFLESRLDRAEFRGSDTLRPPDLMRFFGACVECALLTTGEVDSLPSERALRKELPEDALDPIPRGILQSLREVPAADREKILAAVRRPGLSIEAAIGTLWRLHLFEPAGGGAIALRPRWVARLLGEEAILRMIEDPGRGLGRVLLRPGSAIHPLQLMRDAFLPAVLADAEDTPSGRGDRGWALARHALLTFRPEDAESVALLEGVFQAVGIALLDPDLGFETETLRALWQAQMSVSVRPLLNMSVQPRLFRIDPEERGWARGWEIAALAISERLHQEGDVLAPSGVVPWGGTEGSLREFEAGALHSLARAVEMPSRGWGDGPGLEDPPDFMIDAWRLGGRLYRAFGPSKDKVASPYLYAPFALFDAVEAGGRGSWPGRLEYDFQIDALAELAAERGWTEVRLIEALWRAESSHGKEPIFSMEGGFSEDWQEAIWAALPKDVLEGRMGERIGFEDGLDWKRLSPQHWDVIIARWKANETTPRHGLDHLPEDHARVVIEEGLTGIHAHHVNAVLWARFPDMCRDGALRELVQARPRPEPLGRLWSVPPSEVRSLIELLRAHLTELQADPGARDRATCWAHHHCALRGPHWQLAWRLLSDLAPIVAPRPPSP